MLALSHPDVLNVPEKVDNPETPADETAASPDAVAGDASTNTEATRDPSSESTTPTTATAAQSPVDGSVGDEQPAPAEEDVDPDEQLQQMRDRIKQEQKKAKPTIPTELLNNANSYEDKLMVVRMIVDQERDRVAATLKRMIQVE